jgi:signal transduction histidine kinase
VSQPGGCIDVEIRHAADKVIIDVTDQGAGMQAEFVASQLFQPFRSTKSDGYGIGAYQTRELIRAAHGDLLVLSEPGKGTTMRIVLPITAPSILSSQPRKMVRVAP